MKRALQTLHYEVRTPELSFLCPDVGSECSKLPHLATVDGSQQLLICSINPENVFHPLTSDQKIWLPKGSGYHSEDTVKLPHTVIAPTPGFEPHQVKQTPKKQGISASPPSISSSELLMPTLLELKVPQQIADKFDTFGTFLLQDKQGNKMAIMRSNFRGQPEDITREVLREWLAGKGVEVSWASLLSALRNCELAFTAEQIQSALDHHL